MNPDLLSPWAISQDVECCFRRVALRTLVTYIWSRKSKILSSRNPISHGFPDEKLNLFGAQKLPNPIPQRFIIGHFLALENVLQGWLDCTNTIVVGPHQRIRDARDLGHRYTLDNLL